MAVLRIYALGRFRVLFDQDLLQFPTKKTQDLLCFLLLRAGHPLDRDLIAERLWPMRPPGRARRSLSTTIWRLRQTLEGIEAPTERYIIARREAITFNAASPYWFDVQAFEQQATLGLEGSYPCSEAQVQALGKALGLYQSDFLEGNYDDWCLAEREQLQLILLRVLKRLQRNARLSGAFEAAIAFGQQLVALDPLQEEIHRELMRCYTAAGQRPLALAQFQSCREILRRELQIEPMPETRRLYQQIRRGHEAGLPQGSQEGHPSLQVALTQFRQAIDALESAWRALQSAAADLPEGGQSAPGKRAHPEAGS